MKFRRIAITSLAVLALGAGLYFMQDSGQMTFLPKAPDSAQAVPWTLDLAALPAGLDVVALAAQTSAPRFDCHNTSQGEAGPGDEVCIAPVSRLNTMDAQSAAIYYQSKKPIALRVSASGSAHARWRESLTATLGAARPVPDQRDLHGGPVVGWRVPQGMIILSESLKPEQELVMLWISADSTVYAKLAGPEMSVAVSAPASQIDAPIPAVSPAVTTAERVPAKPASLPPPVTQPLADAIPVQPTRTSETSQALAERRLRAQEALERATKEQQLRGDPFQ